MKFGRLEVFLVILFLLLGGFTLQAQSDGEEQSVMLNKSGLELYMRGDYSAALDKFRSASEQEPGNPEYINNMGMSLLQLNNPAQARQHFERAIQLNQSSAMYRFNLSLAFIQLNQVRAAISALESATKIDPDFFDAWAQMGIIQFQAGNLDESRAAFERALQIQANFEVENYLGIVFLNKDDLNNAELHVSRSINLNSDFFLSHYNMGVIKQRKGDLASAERSYANCIRLNPAYMPAYMNISIVQTNLGKTADARRNLRYFIDNAPSEMRPQIEDARRRLEDLE